MTNKTAKELKEMAKELKVKNWWTMKKTELIAAIEAIQAEETNNAQDAQNDPKSIEEVVNDEVIEEPKEISEDDSDNGWELIAKKQLKNAYDQVVGAYENAVLDGEMTQAEFNNWIAEEALEEVYHEAITTQYDEGSTGGPAPTEMRFAGREFCYKYLTRLLKGNGYKVKNEKNLETETSETEKPTPKRGALIEWNGKSQNICAWGKELGISANTLYGRLYKLGWSVDKAFTKK